MSKTFPTASPFVRTIRDDVADTWFYPVGAVPELTDRNPRGYREDEMLGVIEGFLAGTLMPALEASHRKERVAYEYGRLFSRNELEPGDETMDCATFVARGD